MTLQQRGFHHSHSAGSLSPYRRGVSEHAYQRAARELRDFHRTRSLDVILEEDHPSLSNGGVGFKSGGLKKQKRAIMGLADLATVLDDDTSSHSIDASDNNEPLQEVNEDRHRHHHPPKHEVAAPLHPQAGTWGHYDHDDPHTHDVPGRPIFAYAGRIRQSTSRREKPCTFQRS